MLLFFCFTAKAQTPLKSVTLGSVLFPPSTQINPITGQCFGTSISRTREILNEYNIELSVVCVSAVRVYKMIEEGEVDFTINVRSTRALLPNAIFVEKPFSQITLNMYQYKDKLPMRTVAAIRGFDYAGNRQLLERQNIEFIDQPTSISAIQVFIRQRSDGLLAYKNPVDFYLKSHDLSFDSSVSVTSLMTIDSHYAISKKSKHAKKLLEVFAHFSQQHLYDNLRDTGE